LTFENHQFIIVIIMSDVIVKMCQFDNYPSFTTISCLVPPFSALLVYYFKLIK